MRLIGFPVLAALALALGGCGAVQDLGGLIGVDNQNQELAAVKNPPLAVPPDFDLRPPQKGSNRTGTVQAQRRGRQMVTGAAGGSVVLKDRSAGEAALLRLAGLRSGVDSRIRNEVDYQEESQEKAETIFVDKLLKWKEDGGPEGEAKDDGILPTLGGDSRPVIKKKGEIF